MRDYRNSPTIKLCGDEFPFHSFSSLKRYKAKVLRTIVSSAVVVEKKKKIVITKALAERVWIDQGLSS